MQPVQRFHWGDAAYAEAFATLLRCAGDRGAERQILREIFAAYPATAHAVDWGAGSHVFYHVPEHQWGASTRHAAQHLTANGVLIVSLKTVDSGCNQMLAHFGAPCYDLEGSLRREMRRHPEFTWVLQRAPAVIATTSFGETLQIARFMLCDRAADAFARPPTEEAFQAYVRAHFWDEQQGRGGWECATLFCCVRRHAVSAQQT